MNKLITEIAKLLRYDIDPDFLESTGYQSQAFTNSFTLNIEAQRAWIRIADALEKNNQS